jgi:hypothetical protein
MQPEKLSVVVFQECVGSNVGWVAQVIEQDLATQASSLAALIPEVHRLVQAYADTSSEFGNDVWHGPAAPDEYRAKFDAASSRIEWLGMLPPEVHIPALEIRVSGV